MDILNKKLEILKQKIDSNKKIKIAILGLGSVGNYLLDFLNSWDEKNIEIYIGARDTQKAQKDINISSVSSIIRYNRKKDIKIKQVDLENISSIESFISEIQPDFIVNSSRVYSGLKYGSISWNTIRAYGLWAPLAIKFIKNIMQAYKNTKSNAIVINTSYSDAVIAWLKSANLAYPDFGSGNLNHLIPRIKMAIMEEYDFDNIDDIEIVLATSHFHDVVISKEGQNENVKPLINIKYKDEIINCDIEKIWKKCAIAMPTDAKRNMMNAGSNFEIIRKIVSSLKNNTNEIIHSPGVVGEIGGYPLEINGNCAKIKFNEKYFSLSQMQEANKASIYLDGIEKIEHGSLFYTDELIQKVKKHFNVEIIKEVKFENIEQTAEFIIKNIIEKQIKG